MANENVLVNENSLIAIADAIRSKKGVSTSYTVAEMPSAITSIQTTYQTTTISVTDTYDANDRLVKNISAINISDTTATASDVANGKYFYTADGTKTMGTSGFGGGWTRPIDWPNLSLMNISGGDILYLTYLADEEHGFCDFKCWTVSGQYTVEIGNINNGYFTAVNTYYFNSESWCRKYFGSSNGGYVVIKITGLIKGFVVRDGAAIGTYDNVTRWSSESGLLEMYGKLPHLTLNFAVRISHYLQSCVVQDITPSTLWYAFQDSYMLQNLDTSTWDLKNCTSLECAFRACKLMTHFDCENWDTHNVTNMANTFQNCWSLKSLDISKWNTNKVTTFASFINSCYNLETVNMKDADTQTCTTIDSIARSCWSLKDFNIDGWDTSKLTNINYFLYQCYMLKTVLTENLNLSSVTTSNSFNDSLTSVLNITVPASLATIGTNAFANVRNCSEIHFLRTTPPTLANTNAFNNMGDHSGRKIYVPYSSDGSILNAYKTADKWSTYASYMIEEVAS